MLCYYIISSLYIIERNPLSYTCFANISSCSVGCLFLDGIVCITYEPYLLSELEPPHVALYYSLCFGALALPGLLDFDLSGVKTQVWCSCVPSRIKHRGHPLWALVQPMPLFYLPGSDLWTRSLRSSTSEILGMTSSPPFDSSSSIAEESSEGCPGKTEKSI